MKERRYRILILSILMSFGCVGLYAQANSAITGTVIDKEGAAIPNARVTATDTATGYGSSTNTNSVGVYNIPGLNVGTYDLKVTANGFQTTVQRGLQLNISQVLRSDVALSVGSVSETVTVSANALAVQADSNVVSTLISAEQISEIATQNRNFAALAAIGLGASSLMPDNNTPSSGAGGSSFNFSINGLRQSHNIWLIDGGESDDRGGAGGMQIMPSQDSISQFEVLASNYPPDYGISSGATISLGLKSGTRTFHASAWEFNRNTVYNANYFLNKNKAIRAAPGVNYNIYGFNVGGPVNDPRRLQQRPIEDLLFLERGVAQGQAISFTEHQQHAACCGLSSCRPASNVCCPGLCFQLEDPCAEHSYRPRLPREDLGTWLDAGKPVPQ